MSNNLTYDEAVEKVCNDIMTIVANQENLSETGEFGYIYEHLGDVMKDFDKWQEILSDFFVSSLPCLYCKDIHTFKKDSLEATGVFNVFCNGRCEDYYAQTK